MNFFEDSKRSLRGTGTKTEAPGDQGRKALLGAFAGVAMKQFDVIRGNFTKYIVTTRRNRTGNRLDGIGRVVLLLPSATGQLWAGSCVSGLAGVGPVAPLSATNDLPI